MAASNNKSRRGDLTKAPPIRRDLALGAWGLLSVVLPLPLSLLGACAAAPAASIPDTTGKIARASAVNPPLGCTQVGPERCFNARDDNCNGIVDEGCGVQSGLLQFTIAWDDANADVDLNVQDPRGQLADVGRVTACGLTKERDCPGKEDDCKGRNQENVFLETDDKLTRGIYTVKIRLERSSSSEEGVRVNFAARVGPKTFFEEFEFSKEEEEQRLELKL